MPKLYSAIVEVPIVVVAENDSDAKSQILYYLSEEVANVNISDIDVIETNILEEVPYPWDGSCIPYNSVDDKTCEEILG